MTTKRRARLPLVLMHVRMTATGVTADDLEPFQNDLKAFLEARADLWGLRVKRRVVAREDIGNLFSRYEARAKP